MGICTFYACLKALFHLMRLLWCIVSFRQNCIYEIYMKLIFMSYSNLIAVTSHVYFWSQIVFLDPTPVHPTPTYTRQKWSFCIHKTVNCTWKMKKFCICWSSVGIQKGHKCKYTCTSTYCKIRWVSWMCIWLMIRRLQAGLTPAEVGNILSWRLIMKYFLRSFSPSRWFKKGSCQFLEKECAQYWLTA